MGTINSTPFILSSSASFTVAAGVESVAAAPFDLSNFVNPLSVPVEIADLSIIASIDGVNPQSLGLFQLEMDLRLGRWGITNGFCPIRALGPRREALAVEQAIMVSPAGRNTVDTRWIFPRPLIVGPRESLAGSVRYSPLTTNTSTGTVTVSVAARGRRLDGPMPKTRFIPYASGAFYTSDTAVPPTRTFGNPFRTPLNVTSIGYCNYIGAAAGLPNGMGISIVGPGGLSNAVRVSMASVETAAGFFPISAVFGERLALEESTVLMPDEFYQITGRYITAPTPTQPVSIVMTGYREEA